MTDFSIPSILREQGPQSGAELAHALHLTDVLPLWRHCYSTPELITRRFGRRYLRLDYAVEGFARLSPSIRREFLTYTLVALPEQKESITQRAADLENEMIRISNKKRELALESICMALSGLMDEEIILKNTTFMIAGDITYHMAHQVPRPEKSTGQMVRGSDLDIIAVTTNELPNTAFQALDDAIYRQKHFLLHHPDYQEEIDYVLKPFSKVQRQLQFDHFEHMVACKILCECELLYGSPFIFQDIQQAIDASGVRTRVEELHQRAISKREQAENDLLHAEESTLKNSEYLNLFYTREEGDEIY